MASASISTRQRRSSKAATTIMVAAGTDGTEVVGVYRADLAGVVCRREVHAGPDHVDQPGAGRLQGRRQ